jgi:hypothetical protein
MYLFDDEDEFLLLVLSWYLQKYTSVVRELSTVPGAEFLVATDVAESHD